MCKLYTLHAVPQNTAYTHCMASYVVLQNTANIHCMPSYAVLQNTAYTHCMPSYAVLQNTAYTHFTASYAVLQNTVYKHFTASYAVLQNTVYKHCMPSYMVLLKNTAYCDLQYIKIIMRKWQNAFDNSQYMHSRGQFTHWPSGGLYKYHTCHLLTCSIPSMRTWHQNIVQKII